MKQNCGCSKGLKKLFLCYGKEIPWIYSLIYLAMNLYCLTVHTSCTSCLTTKHCNYCPSLSSSYMFIVFNKSNAGYLNVINVCIHLSTNLYLSLVFFQNSGKIFSAPNFSAVPIPEASPEDVSGRTVTITLSRPSNENGIIRQVQNWPHCDKHMFKVHVYVCVL